MRAAGPLAAVIAPLLVAGCGGPSKSEYIGNVDRICKRAKPAEARAVARLQGAFTTLARAGPGPAARRAARRRFGRALDATVAEERKVLEEVKAEPRPGGDDGEGAERFIAGIEKDLELLNDLKESVTRGDNTGVGRAVTRINARRGDTGRIARDYGFKVCSRG